jgi:hypothetical protein
MKKDIVTKKQAKEMLLVNNDMVHTFYNLPFGIIGGDHSLASVIKDIDNSYMCKRTGEQAQKIGHGLVVIPSKTCKQSDLLFVETK